MAKKTITVVGLTGIQGSSVANHFLQNQDWQVRGVTRNSTSDKAKFWRERGVDVIQADLDDVASLESAFKGSNAIFAVTDYAANLSKIKGDGNLQKQAQALGKSAEAYAGYIEEMQGINAAKAASHPEVLSTLERYVFSTLPAATKISNGKFSKAYEFDAKSSAEEYVRQNLPLLAKRMSLVAMGNYLENWTYITALAPQKEKDGSYSFLWLDCPGKHTAHPELWASKDAGLFVKSLVLDHPAGTNALAATAIIDSKNYAATWSRVMGLPAQSKVVSEDEYSALAPEEVRAAFAEMIKFITEYGVGSKFKTPIELGIKATPLDEFIKNQTWEL